MPSEIREKPAPTPHPDQPRTPGAPGEGARRRGGEPEKAPEFDPDDVVYDSVVDDLNLKLAQPLSEPDPVLKSIDPSGARKPSSGFDMAMPSFLKENRNQPGTAEIFEDVGARPEEITTRRPGWGIRLLSRLIGGAARPRASGPRGAGEAIPAPHHTGEFRRVDAGSHDEENGTDTRGTLLTLVLLSYASAVTLGLAWVLWTGRAIHPAADGTRRESPVAGDLEAAKPREPAVLAALPPIPAENVASMGQTIRIGDVEVTPLWVSLAAVQLVHSIDPGDFRQEEVPSLVLRFKVTNLSKDEPFKPLVRSLIRDSASVHDRSFVALPDGRKIDFYPLAVESEWVILGQEFPVLKPGESVDTLVASAPVAEDRLQGQMTWRIRLRIGPYRTDMLGVRFSRSDLSQ